MSKSAKFGSSKKHMFSRDIAYKVSILMPHPILSYVVVTHFTLM